jgi:hypothetical protein
VARPLPWLPAAVCGIIEGGGMNAAAQSPIRASRAVPAIGRPFA